jgi:hypothetical protein
MPDSNSNSGWGLYTVRKLIEYVGILLAVWQFGLPALNKYVEERIDAYEEEHKSSKSFRTLLSEEMDTPADRIHIAIGDWWSEHEEHEELVDAIYPLLQEELETIRPRLIINPITRRAKWYHTDNELYDASILHDGFYWFHHPVKGWLPCRV